MHIAIHGEKLCGHAGQGIANVEANAIWFLPPRRSQYPSDAEFLEDAMAFNDALHAGMVAHGVDPLSTLLAGVMPTPYEEGEAELTEIYTMQQGD